MSGPFERFLRAVLPPNVGSKPPRTGPYLNTEETLVFLRQMAEENRAARESSRQVPTDSSGAMPAREPCETNTLSSGPAENRDVSREDGRSA